MSRIGLGTGMLMMILTQILPRIRHIYGFVVICHDFMNVHSHHHHILDTGSCTLPLHMLDRENDTAAASNVVELFIITLKQRLGTSPATIVSLLHVRVVVSSDVGIMLRIYHIYIINRVIELCYRTVSCQILLAVTSSPTQRPSRLWELY